MFFNPWQRQPATAAQVVTKLLVSNSIAGSVIGKAGANIEQLQRSSGARIQLSRTGEFFPGGFPAFHILCTTCKAGAAASNADLRTLRPVITLRLDVLCRHI
jgi:hypothetical protein